MASECVHVCQVGPPLKKQTLRKRGSWGRQEGHFGPLLGPDQGTELGLECVHVYQMGPPEAFVFGEAFGGFF